ncbi:nucleotide exchange factor GrpE [Sediminispirochaeta smaragdinae]|uniref:Protein GrpE n=1 Tax=Sediminispirochaeta smaragdinae (strain DSM 11293 / JCM 15392 / SEBR 4228) TaxID=573413 RepID=E1R5G9_SEDSS|nr:nucleotide exchange factor GrpE [Sediminispirochaeta smaragdinae]ADK82297.1 GrpE protein [Sediminispirochaeta smaragdinae DSM 11293]
MTRDDEQNIKDANDQLRTEAEEQETDGTPNIAEGEETEESAPSSAEASVGEQGSDLEAKIRELEAENSDLKDRYLRKQADFENFRKRMLREKEESIKYANSSLISDLITVIDDFERAIRSSDESKDFESFHSGIEMIEKQLVGVLERKYGLSRMESVGKEFDPQLHEAIGMEANPDYDVQTVVEDYQRGYMLHDRVLRHAKVRVAMPAPEKGGQKPEEEPQNEAAKE